MRVSQIFLTLLIAVAPNISQAWTTEDLECLATNIYFEARGESRRGQIAVASVTLNRVKSKIFPNNICEVVYQPYQFSWTLSSNPVIRKQTVFEQITQLAEEVLNGKHRDPTNGSRFFHNFSVAPKWSYNLQQTVVIGNHVFYK
jgi:N-acetylmuramoyl-L-alanine amidase